MFLSTVINLRVHEGVIWSESTVSLIFSNKRVFRTIVVQILKVLLYAGSGSILSYVS